MNGDVGVDGDVDEAVAVAIDDTATDVVADGGDAPTATAGDALGDSAGDAPDGVRPPRRRHRMARIAWTAAATLVAVLGVTVGLAVFAASPTLCGTCHEMRPKVEAWKTSSHTRVGCSGCHETPRPWYRFPETLTERATRLQRDLSAHGVFEGRAVAAAVGSTEPSGTVPDSTCLGCHDLSRKITMKYGTVFDHGAHAKRNGSCLSCHLSTAHPDTQAQRPLLLMSRCFTCHGRQPGAKASGACITCHPKSFSLRPATHATSAWRTGNHGKAALADRQYCSMCHEQSFCNDCHGLVMPHPADWARGAKGHSAFPKEKRYVCSQCHKERPDLCSMCHHRGFEPDKGSWVKQHPLMVNKRGASFCLSCHPPTYCSRCHVNGGAMPPG